MEPVTDMSFTEINTKVCILVLFCPFTSLKWLQCGNRFPGLPDFLRPYICVQNFAKGPGDNWGGGFEHPITNPMTSSQSRTRHSIRDVRVIRFSSGGIFLTSQILGIQSNLDNYCFVCCDYSPPDKSRKAKYREI